MNNPRTLPCLLVGLVLALGTSITSMADYVIVLTSGKTVIAKAPPVEKNGVYVFESNMGHMGFLRPEQIDIPKTQLANQPKPMVDPSTKVKAPEPRMINENELRDRVRYVTLSNEANGDLEGGDYGGLSSAVSPAGTSSGDKRMQLSSAKSRLSAASSERQSTIDNLPLLVDPSAKSSAEARIQVLASEIAALEAEVSALQGDVRQAEQSEAADNAATKAVESVKAQEEEANKSR